jgi:hypothetical protein
VDQATFLTADEIERSLDMQAVLYGRDILGSARGWARRPKLAETSGQSQHPE